jgi:ABC-type transport system involved in multi-copper enzyme maturation permease subunit
MMPFLAILRHDLRTLVASRLVRLWLAGSVLVSFGVTVGNWREVQTAPAIAWLLFPYLVVPWFLVVIVLGISPVSGSRVEELADGILSRPVARYEYLLATWSARVLVVLGVYLVVVVPAILVVSLADRPVPDDTVTLYGTIAAVSLGALVLALQVSLAFLFGTLLRKPLVAVVVLLFIWLPVGGVLNVFKLEEFSPISLDRALPTLLRRPWGETDAGPQPIGAGTLEAWQRDMAHFLGTFSAGPSEPHQPEFGDFSLTRVLLGYGIPTLAAIGLATLCFCYRDLR